MKKEHGEHNESLCSKLLKEGEYNDWTITTAFYSAIHFIDYKLFPITIEGDVYNSIGSIHRLYGKYSKHKTRELLVCKYLSEQKENYAFLSKNCWNARYENYKVNPQRAQIAKDKLNKIKEACLS